MDKLQVISDSISPGGTFSQVVTFVKENPVIATIISGGTFGIIWAYGKLVFTAVTDFFLWCISFSMEVPSQSFSSKVPEEIMMLRPCIEKLGFKLFLPKHYTANLNTDDGPTWYGYSEQAVLKINTFYGKHWFYKFPFTFLQLNSSISEAAGGNNNRGYKVDTNITLYFANKAKFFNRFKNVFQESQNKENKLIVAFPNECNTKVAPRPLSTVYTNDNIAKDIVEDIQQFLNSEEFYIKNGIPYKRTFLLYGEPGTGKTSLVKGVVSYLHFHLLYTKFSMFSKTPLSASSTTHFINLLEDLDVQTSFNLCRNSDKPKAEVLGSTDPASEDEKNITKENANEKYKASISELLNSLDGVNTPHGAIIFITTNHIEALDPAIIRDGRVDKRIYMGKLKPEVASKMIKEKTGIDFAFNKSVSPATLQELCIQYLLRKTTKENLISKLDQL